MDQVAFFFQVLAILSGVTTLLLLFVIIRDTVQDHLREKRRERRLMAQRIEFFTKQGFDPFDMAPKNHVHIDTTKKGTHVPAWPDKTYRKTPR